ncbi:CGNR zinc finger domain-containing protein [Burkholderia cepacia]|uniref:CGNR zinc finger domain-containing protein n=1 Tax=Burkholderia cepacia TaxID=292 RepID=UPI001C932D69|nr:CGNR zinc finger domain-containing protein [Burkholderia cepacia]MBY4713506.1 CGNR zinc finger domain-containing protein [Burkholderia cepacia]MBY4741144.1 CGNR zinc finger domain-containing protein [Burkholderia cepacia]MBY4748517.1 CGNR zinc finger domain-containing protein [Burkholderia cepacia]MBY4762193.1 CGNR zinc finger domain-containing protein [Burkholderia cepacia]MBY4775833.1 CGNR zinc finger domain-containing protein [Burkholderia cepacia]
MVTRHEPVRHAHEWGAADFVGGHPALDFLNTVADTGKTRDADKFVDWPAVHAWAERSGLLVPADLARLLRHARQDDADALVALRRFREEAYTAIAHLTAGSGGTAGARAAGRLAVAIREAIGRSAFDAVDGRFAWRPDARVASRWVDAAALGFEHLLRSDDFARVRQCGRCTWFFVDRGRGVGRRWCDMRTCGNRAKVEAFRER